MANRPQNSSAHRRKDNKVTWDAFISHASEDKDGLVRPLAKELTRHGLKIWYDEFTITLGDSLRRSIDRGLVHSRFGIVIVSPSFLKKEWTQRELDGLVAREVSGTKVILPVWHNVTRVDIMAYSPTLADRLAASSTEGTARVAQRILEAINSGPLDAPVASTRSARSPTASPQFANTMLLIAYCSRCGSPAGKKNDCLPGYGSHNFVPLGASSAYCSRCGSPAGKKNDCLPGYGGHDFVPVGASGAYCSRCGSPAGEKNRCFPGYGSHNFVDG
jgi:hypothetical protein